MKRKALGGALFLLFLFGLCVAGPSFAQSTSGAASLLITPGARADGMGRAFVALPTDATANWWNPAALALQQGRVVSLMHAQLVPDLADDVYYENIGFASNLPGWGGVGFSFIYLGYGKSMATDEEGEELGYFTSYEISPQVSIGTTLMNGLYAGTTLKYVRVSLAPEWALRGVEGGGSGVGNTFGADLALLAQLKELAPMMPVPVNLGVNVQNLGPKIAYIDEDQADPIGRNLKIGLGVQFLNLPAVAGLVSYDFNKSLVYSSEDPIHNMGAEVSYKEFFSLRAGYIYDAQGDITDPTFGLGFILPIGTGSKLAFDYASVPQAEVLDRVNKFSLSFQF